MVEIDVAASDPEGTIPVLSTSTLPLGAWFIDYGDGTGYLSYFPFADDVGIVTITFYASDGDLQDVEHVPFTVINGDSVVVVSKKVPLGAAGVDVRVRLVNPTRWLWNVQVPLEIRASSTGSFVTSLGMSFADRLLNPDVLLARDAVRIAVPEAPPCVSSFDSYDRASGESLLGLPPKPVAASPEGLLFWGATPSRGAFTADADPTEASTPPNDVRAAAVAAVDLAPGTDAAGSLVFTVNVNATPGTFDIIQTCVQPWDTLAFDGGEVSYPPVFAPGVITINSPPVTWDSCVEVYSGSAISVQLPATDADDPASALSYTLVQPPAEGTTIDFNSATGVYQYEAPGGELTDSIMFSVFDGYDVSATHRFCFDIVAAVPDTYWVSVYGDNGKDGSESSPFRTITHAMTMTSPNLVIMVGPGTYAEPTIRFPARQSVELVSTDGPFATHLTGDNTDGLGPIVVMDAESDAAILVLDGFTIRDNEVMDSHCNECVGGVQVASPTTAHIVNNIISGNVGFMAGGIEYAGGGGGLVANNWIVRNSSKHFTIPRDISTQGRPGGVSIPSTGGVRFLNNTVARNGGLNDVEVAGVWVSMELSLSVFDNNIIAFNQPGVGFATSLDITTLPMYNCLYFDNGDTVPVPDGVHTATAWLNVSPLFRDTANGDCHLSCGSPARDAGRTKTLDDLPIGLDSLLMKIIAPEGVPVLSIIDIDRQQRPRYGTSVDIGADEFHDDAKVASFVALPASGCAPLTVLFDNKSECLDESWSWQFGDGSGSDLKSPTHEYSSPGDYEVRLVAFGVFDTATTYDTVRVGDSLTAGFEADVVEGCVGIAVTFTPSATAAVDEYHWDFGDGGTSELAVPTHVYDTPAAIMYYDVTLTLTNVCDTVTVLYPDYIKVLGKPTAVITSSLDGVTDLICAPYTVHFEFVEASEEFDSVRWDFGDNKRSTEFFPDHTYLEGKTYSVLFTGYGDCDSVRVVRSPFFTFLQRPTAVLNARTSNVDTLFCCVDVDTARLTVDITGETAEPEWLLGDGNHLFGTSVEHVYTELGRYVPKVILTHECGTDLIPVGDTIVVGMQPVADFTVEIDSVYQPDPIVFIDLSLNNPRQWFWTFGDGDSALVSNPQHVYQPGTYSANLSVANSCGSDTTTDQTVRVGGFLPLIVDSLDAQGDTIFYSVQVDALVLAYDNPVYLSGGLTATPRRGSIVFAFTQSSAVPPYSTVMRAIRSSDLSTGNYTIVVTATDSLRLKTDGTPISKQATRPLAYKAAAFLQIDPSPLAMGKAAIGNPISKDLVLSNVADHDSVVLQAPLLEGEFFAVVFGSGGTLPPGGSTRWTVQFTPTRKGDFTAKVRVRSNDPAKADSLVPVAARAVSELRPPRVAITQPATGQELRIDKPLKFEFDERMRIVPLDTILSVRSALTGAAVPGTGSFTDNRRVSFVPDEWFTHDDTLSVRFRSCVTDTNSNFLDGDADGIEEGTPDDDFLADVPTGPGVYPGDTDNDGAVNERDILPLGRFLGMIGDGRDDDGSVFALQPATAWTPRAATYADANGDGDVDSMDICPIADFFDTDVDLAKLTLEGWLAAAEHWSGDVVDKLIAGLEYCNGEGEGHAALREILLQMKQATPLPADYALAQNYPNPFNPTTVIAYTLRHDGEVRLEVFDVRGRRVLVLDSGFKTAGRHWTVWDGRDDDGRPVASGVYFYRLETRDFRFARKMVLLK
ncbi:MAG TPA: PKD domain-containing protein [Acidobacteriota bacterium]|nr:PKD domain-containing protein [Acidobacteriota bacterium]